MNAAGMLATLAVLLLPVGLNRSLRGSGARIGLWRTLPLVGAGWLANCLAIGTWCTALGLLIASMPAARPATQVVAAVYLLGTLLARRRHDAVAGPWCVFPAAMADPVVLWCAVFAFPALGSPVPMILAAYGWFSALMLPAGLAWAAAGAGMLRRPMALRRPLRRVLLLATAAARVR